MKIARISGPCAVAHRTSRSVVEVRARQTTHCQAGSMGQCETTTNTHHTTNRSSMVSTHNASTIDRRHMLVMSGAPWMLMMAPWSMAIPAAQAAGLKGFEAVKDQQDGYQFVYPFGWQEVSVNGQDVVYKDVIEPLESVSVGYIPTEKKSIQEYGDVKEVCYTLVTRVLNAQNQDVKLLNCEERELNGRTYYDFEFTAATPRYTRHAMASVTVGNGKFYTLETGANERRWGKVGSKAKTVLKSFEVFDRQDY